MLDFPLVTTPLLAFVVAMTLHIIALQLFPRWTLLDFPERYGLKRARLPYPTGILAFIVFLLIFPLTQAIIDRSALGTLIAVIILGITCFIDDRRQLPAIVRLFIQALCAFIVVWSGDCTGGRVCSITNPFEGFMGGPIIDLNGMMPMLAIGVTMLWLMITTNALNWFDGIPGQVSTISIIGFSTIGFLSLSDRVDQPELALLAFCLAGIALGCLLFDFPPPRVVMGDSGSMFFGLMLGILTVYAGGKVATAFLVLGVPIIDLLFVIIKRVTEGRSPFKGSMSGEHLHHRLQERGWPSRSIIGLTASIGLTFGGTALFLNTFGKLIAAVILLVVMLILWLYSSPSKSTKHRVTKQ